MRSLLFLISAMLIHTTSFPALAESEVPQYAVGLGLDVSSGTFGTDSTSTYVYMPLIIDWFPTGRLDLELTVPLLYQRTQNTGVAAIGGTTKSTARRTMNGQYVYTGVSSTVAGGGTVDDSELGLGDITLTGGYALIQDSNTAPLIRPTFYVKFPTADETKGLGTGKLDIGPGLAVSKWLGRWQPFGEGRYIFQGASEESGARDYFTAETGIGYSWNERLYTSAYSRFGSVTFDGMDAPLDIRLKSVWRFGKRTYTEVYALKGLSDGSPDYGGGVSVFAEF
ncbi:MAG: transporter [Desulfuromonadaceae bacterium]|nr:transporter [Desulfuromonadaceae bacterium]